MEVWNLIRLKTQLDSMREHKRNTTEEQVIYVLNPFIASLGYDIYDISSVDVQVTKGRVMVQPVPNVNVVFAVTSPTPSNAKVFVHIDVKKYQMKVYMFAMHKWELVDVVDLGDATEPNSSVYSSVLRMVAQEAFQIMYAEREERMFTERILRSKLESGAMHNEFTVAAVKRLFDRPTEAFLSAIAQVLAEDYSTDDSNEIYGYLQPMQSQGIRSLVTHYAKDLPMTTDTQAPPVQPVAPVYEPEPVVSAPVPAPVYEAPPTVPTVEPAKIKVSEEHDEKLATLKEALAAAIIQEPAQESPTPKADVSMTDVLSKKPAGNNIAEMFGGEKPTRTVPRTKSL